MVIYEKNILFVCTMNKIRSLTAEEIFKDIPNINVKSCGLSNESEKQINETLIKWSHIIFVMENKQQKYIKTKYKLNKKIVNLDIPDEFDYMDPILIRLLKIKTQKYL